MFKRQRRDADHLNAIWDESVMGQPATAKRYDEGAISSLRWLLKKVETTLPSVDFVAHLEQEIAASALRPGSVRPSMPNAWVVRGHRFAGSSRRPKGYLRATAVVFVTIAVVSTVVLYRSALDPSNPAPTFPALAAVSLSPVATALASESPGQTNMVRFDECTVPPLPDGYLDGLSGDAAELPALASDRSVPDSDDGPRTQPIISSLPPDDAPSSETLELIRQTVRTLTACRYFNSEEDGPNGRYIALFTDDAHRRESVRSDDVHVAYWVPRSSIPPLVGDARQLDEDHVVAFVHDNGLLLVVLFARQANDWLVDAIVGYSIIDSEVLPEAYGDDSVDGVETLLLVNEAPGNRSTGGNTVLLANSRYQFVFHNLGSNPRRFVSDQLGVDITIPPFETETAIVSAPAGDHVFQTFTSNTVDPAANDSCNGYPFPGNIVTFYPEPPLRLNDGCGSG